MADTQQLKAEFQLACAAVEGEATEANFVNWLIVAKAGKGPGDGGGGGCLVNKRPKKHGGRPWRSQWDVPGPRFQDPVLAKGPGRPDRAAAQCARASKRSRGTQETADGQKLQLWGWAPSRTAHPYIKAHPEVLDILLKTPDPDKYPTHAEKEAALKAAVRGDARCVLLCLLLALRRRRLLQEVHQ
ncbi:hypothetical protein CYMTET_39614 [Cymbomonas tetramitiformis]|uniref:Uncharacterized protein n=1 Tax=Cymbomonas tetramitiformis TaxID=36881 RepID=A0AAE0F5F3_9CHLO|nr:hypothetical protein CYMTET_39614 [Cymbomonas tetramitiformis]